MLKVIIFMILGFGISYIFNLCIKNIPTDKPIKSELLKIGKYFSLPLAIITAVIYGLIAHHFAFGVELFSMLFLASILIPIFKIDFDHYIIPNRLNLIGFVGGIVFMFLSLSKWKDLIFGMLIGGGTFLIIYFLALLIFRQEGLGFGDVKLMFVVGLFLGIKNTVVTMVAAFVVGAIISIILLATKKKTGKEYLAFGPYIVIGVFIAMFWGDLISSWYLSGLIS